MSNHENFKILSALQAIGEISPDEERDLREHITDCADCHKTHAEYLHLVGYELPRTALVRSRFRFTFSQPTCNAALRGQFISKARAEGFCLSSEAERFLGIRPVRSWMSWPLRMALAAALVIVVGFFAVTGFRNRRQLEHSTTPIALITGPARSKARAPAELASLRQALSEASAQLDQTNAANAAWKTSFGLQLDQERERAETLSRELQEIRIENGHVLAELERRTEENTKLSAEVRQTLREKADVASSNQQMNGLVATLREQVKSSDRENNTILNNSAAQQAQLRHVTEELNQRVADLERERELTVASNEVRQLMGARKLHIIDVKDLDGGHNPPRAFGRVFYAEGQSLIFYAFDLPINGNGRPNYHFQVWGARESSPLSARNLGALASDETEQGRWILKVSDTRLFSGIDSVFVTAESKSPSSQPRGKKLLYAYIAGQPNHP